MARAEYRNILISIQLTIPAQQFSCQIEKAREFKLGENSHLRTVSFSDTSYRMTSTSNLQSLTNGETSRIFFRNATTSKCYDKGEGMVVQRLVVKFPDTRYNRRRNSGPGENSVDA